MFLWMLDVDAWNFPDMGLFSTFKAGLQKTHNKLTHEIKRIVTRSPKLDAGALEELEAALIGADLGMQMTGQIVSAVKRIRNAGRRWIGCVRGSRTGGRKNANVAKRTIAQGGGCADGG